MRDEHLADAARLFVAGYGQARERTPMLPACHEDTEAILPKLRGLAAKQPGVAAIRQGQLAGFLMGQVLGDWRGKRSIYCPEWAHGAAGPNRPDTYRAMYAELAPHWLADGCFTHLVTVLADQAEAIDAFVWLEFGMMAVDAMRDLTPVPAAAEGIDVRRAGPEDARAVLEFARGLQQHMAASPMFVPLREPIQMEAVDRTLADPDQAIFLACRDREPVACVEIQSANPSAAHVIQDAKTASIKRTFTRLGHRGRGIAAALLARAIEWARDAGYERCSVDFEPQNIPGSRFWLKHFRPVCYSLIRHIDKAIAAPDNAAAPTENDK